MKDLEYIEGYIKDRKYNTPALDTLCDIAPNGEFRHWARFSMLDDENDHYTDFVQAVGSSFEEVTHKIAEYLKSSEHYADDRYL